MQHEQAIQQLPDVARQVQSELQWKPNSAMRHLRKRKSRGHLSVDATLDDYSQIIKTVLKTDTAKIFLYSYGNDFYPTVVTVLEDKHWLVMFSMEGVMETAFIVENPDTYLSPPEFEPVGLLYEVLS